MTADEIRAKIETLILGRREDFAGLSKLLGRNAAYMQQYVKRGVPRLLSETDRQTLARYFRIDEQELGLTAVALPGTANLVPIKSYLVRASAGHGSFNEDEPADLNFAFSIRWLKQLTQATSTDLSVIRVHGDSMSPTLADGDDILVDRSELARHVQDGIYVIRSEDALLVKRITAHPSGAMLTVSSDNPAYASWPDCSPQDVHILGRVVWAGRRIF